MDVMNFVGRYFETSPSLEGMSRGTDFPDTNVFPPRMMKSTILVGFFTTMADFELEIKLVYFILLYMIRSDNNFF